MLVCKGLKCKNNAHKKIKYNINKGNNTGNIHNPTWHDTNVEPQVVNEPSQSEANQKAKTNSGVLRTNQRM